MIKVVFSHLLRWRRFSLSYLKISIFRDNKLNKFAKNALRMDTTNRDLLEKFSNKIGFPAISLVYHPDEELEENDLFIIMRAIKSIKSEQICLILHGANGGHFSPAIDLAVFLRDKFRRKLITIVPRVAASAKCYIALLSNKLFMAESSYLTQFDIVFTRSDGKTYRAHEALTDSNPEVEEDGHFIWNMSFNILKEILTHKGSLVINRPFEDPFIGKIMDVCMRKKRYGHDSIISLRELKKLGLNVHLIEEEDKLLLQSIVDNALSILIEKKKKFSLESQETTLYF